MLESILIIVVEHFRVMLKLAFS